MSAYIEELSQFVTHASLDTTPSNILKLAEEILLDTLGSLLAASSKRYSASQRLLSFIQGQGGVPESTLIGTSNQVGCVNASLYNGTLGYYCDLDAHHPGAIMHAPAIVVPSALAIAERERKSGVELLMAIIVGVDVACRVSNAIGPTTLYSRGQHPTCIAGGFGAAAAAGYLLGLDDNQMRIAWGLVGTQASGLLAWETDPTENSRPFNPGIAARNGTTGAVLASYDFGGPPDIFEGKFNIIDALTDSPNLDELTDGLGKRYLISELAFKQYACCAFLHPGLDGLDAILSESDLQADDINSIQLRFPKSGVALIDNNPLRSHCGQYVLPIYVLEHKVIVDDILNDRRNEPAIADISKRVQVLGDDELDCEFPERYTTIIEVITNRGTFTRKIPYAKGCPENPLSTSELEDKFRRLAGSITGDENVERIINEVSGIMTAPSVAELISSLSVRA